MYFKGIERLVGCVCESVKCMWVNYLGLREKDKSGKSGKPPVCLRNLIKAGDGKTRKKQVTETVFGMYQHIFPILLCDVLI